jgi:hypothetical protein
MLRGSDGSLRRYAYRGNARRVGVNDGRPELLGLNAACNNPPAPVAHRWIASLWRAKPADGSNIGRYLLKLDVQVTGARRRVGA